GEGFDGSVLPPHAEERGSWGALGGGGRLHGTGCGCRRRFSSALVRQSLWHLRAVDLNNQGSCGNPPSLIFAVQSCPVRRASFPEVRRPIGGIAAASNTNRSIREKQSKDEPE